MATGDGWLWAARVGSERAWRMARREAWEELATLFGISLPGFSASAVVYASIDPIATGRWRPLANDAGLSLGLVVVAAYLTAGLLIAGASTDPDIAWGGGGVVTVFSLGTLLPIWVGLGAAATDEPLFSTILWLQPILAIAAYLLGLSLMRLLRGLMSGVGLA